jgi:hypothetical protein
MALKTGDEVKKKWDAIEAERVKARAEDERKKAEFEKANKNK